LVSKYGMDVPCTATSIGPAIAMLDEFLQLLRGALSERSTTALK
jgi:hypothetical protein